jgi:hypothetical protein
VGDIERRSSLACVCVLHREIEKERERESRNESVCRGARGLTLAVWRVAGVAGGWVAGRDSESVEPVCSRASSKGSE